MAPRGGGILGGGRAISVPTCAMRLMKTAELLATLMPYRRLAGLQCSGDAHTRTLALALSDHQLHGKSAHARPVHTGPSCRRLVWSPTRKQRGRLPGLVKVSVWGGKFCAPVYSGRALKT